ncbi:putative amino acid permease [Lyophyllum shimeji]|uniref:Amino acid permease n=1 Tax=Lyophyllum shimeji TaxID=47721 RepID=A0A9P3PPM7_LYOSH|nr:putative amino acid permease [Lyophyllum shimeji]
MSRPLELKSVYNEKDGTPAYLEEQEVSEASQHASRWIAIEPPQSLRNRPRIPHSHSGPPSFRDSQFDVILRRQRMRPTEGGGLKLTALPSRFLNLPNDFEFAGWGSVSRITLDKEDQKAGEERLSEIRGQSVLGQFTASALAGNAVLGSVFYALPAVVAVSSVYSPISLFIATLVLFLWRPIMEELVSALPLSGAPYTYILNVSTKSLALVGAALLLLDFASTAVVSAATAASYLAGEVTLPFPPFVGAISVIVVFTLVSLAGLKESARIALVVLSFHLATMAVLIVSSSIYWGKTGVDQLRDNWYAGSAPSASVAARHIFNGFCLGMLGLTGVECTPSYVGRIKKGQFPLVLRNLHIPAIILNCLIMVMVLAVVPLKAVHEGANVLSVLAQIAAGQWLRTWVVVDAIIVLCGGVFTGIFSACELLEQLALHRVLPKVFLQALPRTKAPYFSVLSFVAFAGVVYASAGADLTVISNMFSLVWLTVMSLFPLALLLLKFSRGRLPRNSSTPLAVVVAAAAVSAVVFAGNIAVDPATAGYFAAYFIGIVTVFTATQNKIHLLRWVYWVYDQYPRLHSWKLTKTWGCKLIDLMTSLKRQPVCILVKTDEINHLFHMILYVRKNEETSCVKMVFFNEGEEGVPSELEANAKILDEAFPEITIDLVIVDAAFEPANVIALSHRLQISTSLMLMTCPGPAFPYSIAELGTRIICL